MRVAPLRRSYLSRHVDDLLLQLLALELQVLDGLEEELVAIPLPRALDGEDKVVAPTAQFHLALELVVAQALAADGIAHGVDDDGLQVALATGVWVGGGALFRSCRLLARHLFQADDARGEALCKLFGVGAQDGLRDGDGGEQAVRGGGDGGELCVVGADALVHVHGQVDGLAGPQLGDKDVRVGRADGVFPRKVLGLLARGHEDDVFGVDVRVAVGLEGVVFRRGSVRVNGALDIELEANRVPVEAARVRVLAGRGLLVPLEELVEALAPALEGHEAQAVGEHLVLDDRGIVLDVDVLDGEGGDLGQQDAAEGVGDGGVDAYERKGGQELVVLVEVDGEAGAEPVDAEGVVFAGEVARVVCRGVVGDRLEVDVDRLRKLVLAMLRCDEVGEVNGWEEELVKRTLRRASSSSSGGLLHAACSVGCMAKGLCGFQPKKVIAGGDVGNEGKTTFFCPCMLPLLGERPVSQNAGTGGPTFCTSSP